jgi:hypothetical protein
MNRRPKNQNWKRNVVLAVVVGVTGIALAADTAPSDVNSQPSLRVPAFTAYTLPNPEGARIGQRHGLTGWTDPALTVNWYGQFKQTGDLSAKVTLRLPEGAMSHLQLTVAGQTRQTRVTVPAAKRPRDSRLWRIQIAASVIRILSSNPQRIRQTVWRPRRIAAGRTGV